MKTLKLSNGEIRIGYELDDLSPEVRKNVIIEHGNFLDETGESCENEDGEMITEYFEHSENDIIHSIDINEYLFSEDGEMLPIMYHTKGNKVVKTVFTYGKKEYEVTFI